MSINGHVAIVLTNAMSSHILHIFIDLPDDVDLRFTVKLFPSTFTTAKLI